MTIGTAVTTLTTGATVTPMDTTVGGIGFTTRTMEAMEDTATTTTGTVATLTSAGISGIGLSNFAFGPRTSSSTSGTEEVDGFVPHSAASFQRQKIKGAQRVFKLASGAFFVSGILSFEMFSDLIRTLITYVVC